MHPEEIIVGVLALQGAFREHMNALEKCGVQAIEIKFPQQLDGVDGLVIPGGESTTIYKLIQKYNFEPALEIFYKKKKPIFGTCAGLILLAKEVINDSFGLGYIDITVDRNAYGRQVDSFEQVVELELGHNLDEIKPGSDSDGIKLVSDSDELKCGQDANNAGCFKSGKVSADSHNKFKAVFIRAPRIEKTGEKVRKLSCLDSRPVLARQENVLVCAFHPELTDDLRIHKYFIDMVIKSKSVLKLN